MSLHDRIMGLPNDKDANLAERVGFRVAQKEAAILSKEADELMAEMAEAIQLQKGVFETHDVLERYKKYKETTK